MKIDVGKVFEQAVTIYSKMPLAQKVAIPLLIIGSMATIVFVSRWASETDYGVLFSGLEEADAASVVERLKDQRIGYRLRDAGSTIDVTPPKLVHELRLEFAAAGIPKGGSVGYELFKETSLGQTAFVEESVKFIQAIQGELERTIGSIDSVKNVRIHITSPKRSVFVKRDVLPTASVLLRLKSGYELDKKQVKGIANLVSNSVERLTPENVTVIDSKGNILNEQAETTELGGMATTKLEFKRTLENEYARRVETMLTEVMGPGKAIARVTADLDFNKYEKEEESYDPGGTVVRSSRSSQESVGVGANGGIPGVVSNLTNELDVLGAPDSSKDSNSRSETVTNYEVSRAVSRTTTDVGTIKRLSVAVLVDGKYAASGVEGDTSEVYQPLEEDMLKKIENLVKQSVGFDGTRGDIVTVENIPFFDPGESLEEVFAQEDTLELIKYVVELATPYALAFLLFILVSPMVKFLVKPTEAEVDLTRLLPEGIEDLEAELETERSKLPGSMSMAEPSVDIEELEELLSENSRLVKDNPQQAALLIRYWLNETR